jgi:hypothetical protein
MHNNGGRNQNNRPRHNNGGGSNNYGNNRPRKNYPQLREKYMNQARDALSAGDRVMAEYYFQHADHCYRMMMEEGSHRPRPQQHADGNQQAAQETNENANNANSENSENESAGQVDDHIPQNSSALPAFLTMGAVPTPSEAPPVQDWEERDAN